MKRLSPQARPSPLMLVLLSLGMRPLQSMRAIRVPVSEPATGTAAMRRRLARACSHYVR
jgi:hypothetical protein